LGFQIIVQMLIRQRSLPSMRKLPLKKKIKLKKVLKAITLHFILYILFLKKREIKGSSSGSYI